MQFYVVKCPIKAIFYDKWQQDQGIYCRVPGGQGLQRTARPLSRDETQSVNPLVLHRWTSPNVVH